LFVLKGESYENQTTGTKQNHSTLREIIP
jgi:hypothetical protein